MSSTVINVENLSKQYRLGQVGAGSLSHDLNRLWHRIRGNKDPYLMLGEENKREKKGLTDYVWALKDVNFDINQGDRVGIIGRNGAGKSTLLKILSRTVSATTGTVRIKGKVASLLEIGTGFHPDLSGRDNIFLNGAILGMTKRDIISRFDQILDFAGVERYIDTPIKRYSSGMYVRLAFAVAAHLESDILIVDEVLAVGDAEFQKKCLGKMNEVSEGEGKTVLFVSHNMAAVKELCKTGISLTNGIIGSQEQISKVIDGYLREVTSTAYYVCDNNDSVNGHFISAYLFNEAGINTNELKGGSSPYLVIKYSVKKECRNFNVAMLVTDAFGMHIFSNADTDLDSELLVKKTAGIYKVKVPLPLYNLNTGNYKVKLLMGINNTELFDNLELSFTIESDNFINTGVRQGLLIASNKWYYEK